MRPEARAWWNEAQVELAAAHDLFGATRYNLCAFFCPQAIEKAFKALWIIRHEEMPPKTHDVTDLGSKLGVPSEFASVLRELNPLFVTTTNPDASNGEPAAMFDEHIARERLNEAEQVMAWYREQVDKS